MNRRPCALTALFLTAVYLVIVLGPPLAPLALCSPKIAHAVTGECVGDCDICGCSAEQRANHTCCCWRKKHQHDHDHENELPDCCKKKHGGNGPILSCGCPCGGTKHLAFFGSENEKQFPYSHSHITPGSREDDLASSYRKRFTDRHDDPPDPPPRLTTPA